MINKTLVPFVVLIVVIFGCTPEIKEEPPLIDGSVADYQRLGIAPVSISEEVNFYQYQNEHYVWLAYDYPDGSYGTIDLKLVSPNLSDTLNLHVSGQIGEWWVEKGSPRPDRPESDLWWNHQGWYANEVWINGMDTTGGNARYKFKNGKAREIQLSKARFGKGVWNLQLNINAIRTNEGAFKSVRYPSDSTFFELNVH